MSCIAVNCANENEEGCKKCNSLSNYKFNEEIECIDKLEEDEIKILKNLVKFLKKVKLLDE